MIRLIRSRRRFFDAGNGATVGSDWYEGPGLPGPTLTMYGQDGVEHPPSGLGFQTLRALTDVHEVPLAFLNPQTQMNVLGSTGHGHRWKSKPGGRGGDAARASKAKGAGADRAARAARRLAP
jgi:hypothetical protein